jgi:hypothetical protein
MTEQDLLCQFLNKNIKINTISNLLLIINFLNMKNTINIKSTLFATALFLAAFMNSFAQETPPAATVFAGSLDMYYKYDFSKFDNSKTSFTRSNDSFELGMASIEASHKIGKASVFVDLGFGTRASEFTYNDASTTFMVKQMYVNYDFSPSFKVTAGSFGTHIGYELLDAIDNKNYSMSYAFTNGPFFNTGVKAQYTVGKYNFMAGVTNPTDFKSAVRAGSTQKTVIAQLGYTGDTGSAFFNFTSGSVNPISTANKTQFDLVASKKIGEKLSLGFNGTYALTTDDVVSGTNSWYSVVGYANVTLKKNLSLAYRAEYFDDKDGVVGLAATVFANTLSLNFKEGNLTFIPEFRLDSASENIFTDGAPQKTTAYVLLATTYSF